MMIFNDTTYFFEWVDMSDHYSLVNSPILAGYVKGLMP